MADRRNIPGSRTPVGSNPFPQGSTGARQWENLMQQYAKQAARRLPYWLLAELVYQAWQICLVTMV